MIKMRNKKGITPLLIILIVVLALIVIYVLLLLPIPAFATIRTIINYFLILIFWIVLQVGLVYGYYKIGSYVATGFKSTRHKLQKLSLNIEKYILAHS
jgi:hypothetical protein